MTIAQKSYDVAPGTDINDNAGFVPLSVLVDNYSPYWLLLPDAGRYVPPYTSGVVLPLIHADVNRAQWSNPPISGLSNQTYVGTAGFAHLTYVDAALAYSAGAAVPYTALSQQQAFSANEGDPIVETLPFLAQGVRIDNPGGTCYTIVGTSLIIPPWTTAWLANFTTPFNAIDIEPIANPNGIPNSNIGGPIVATFYAQPVSSSGGSQYTQPSFGFSSDPITNAVYNDPFLAGIDRMAGQKQLKSIVIPTAPSVPCAFQIYRLTGNVTGTYAVENMNALNPQGGAFPGECVSSVQGVIPTTGTPVTASGIGVTTINVGLPAFNTGNLLVVLVACANISSAPACTGWTLIYGPTNTLGILCAILARVAQPGDPSTVTVTGIISNSRVTAIAANVFNAGPNGTATVTSNSGTVTAHTFGATTAHATPYVNLSFAWSVNAAGTVTATAPWVLLQGGFGLASSPFLIGVQYGMGRTVNPETPNSLTSSNSITSVNISIDFDLPVKPTYTLGSLLYTTGLQSTAGTIDLLTLGIIADVNAGLAIVASPASTLTGVQLITN